MAVVATSETEYRLLLVDDSAAERDFYEMLLEREFRILTASGGSTGVLLAAQEHPDAVVLDVMMPGMDGWETCTRLKRDPHTAGIPVILLTAADDADLFSHAKAVGATAVVTKPCSARRLRETIHSALHGKRDKAVWGNKH